MWTYEGDRHDKCRNTHTTLYTYNKWWLILKYSKTSAMNQMFCWWIEFIEIDMNWNICYYIIKTFRALGSTVNCYRMSDATLSLFSAVVAMVSITSIFHILWKTIIASVDCGVEKLKISIYIGSFTIFLNGIAAWKRRILFYISGSEKTYSYCTMHS